jgi:hypothetical protein
LAIAILPCDVRLIFRQAQQHGTMRRFERMSSARRRDQFLSNRRSTSSS